VFVRQGEAVACAGGDGGARRDGALGLRVSFGWSSRGEDIDAAIASLRRLIARPRGAGGVGVSRWQQYWKQPNASPILAGEKYKYGFVTDIEMERAEKGLNEDIVRFISAKKNEPEWMLEWRLEAFRRWKEMTEPKWARVHYPPIDYQNAYYYAAPKSQAERPKNLDEVDPKLIETYKKLGIPLSEQKLLAGVAVDAVFDSVSWPRRSRPN
jgi:hypothetical protein